MQENPANPSAQGNAGNMGQMDFLLKCPQINLSHILFLAGEPKPPSEVLGSVAKHLPFLLTRIKGFPEFNHLHRELAPSLHVSRGVSMLPPACFLNPRAWAYPITARCLLSPEMPWVFPHPPRPPSPLRGTTQTTQNSSGYFCRPLVHKALLALNNTPAAIRITLHTTHCSASFLPKKLHQLRSPSAMDGEVASTWL